MSLKGTKPIKTISTRCKTFNSDNNKSLKILTSLHSFKKITNFVENAKKTTLVLIKLDNTNMIAIKKKQNKMFLGHLTNNLTYK